MEEQRRRTEVELRAELLRIEDLSARMVEMELGQELGRLQLERVRNSQRARDVGTRWTCWGFRSQSVVDSDLMLQRGTMIVAQMEWCGILVLVFLG